MTELDGVRGCAILLVLVWHYIQNQIHAEPGSLLADLKQALAFTWSGVDLFFVLSGFLIASILLEKRDEPHYFKAFYVRRICRIFPLYFLNLAVFMLFVVLGLGQLPGLGALFSDNGVPFWSYLTFTQNIMMAAHNSAGPNWLAVTWSLAVEEQFYLLFPFLVRYFPASKLPLLFIWFAAMAVYMRISLPGLSSYINTLWRADSLMIGALLAYFVRSPGFFAMARRYRVAIAGALLVSAMAIGFINFRGGLALGGPLTHLSLALFYGMFILLALLSRDGVLGRFLRNRFLVWMGMISYGVYIIHTGISQLFHALIRADSPSITTLPAAATTLLAFMVTVLIAHISYYFMERRFIDYGHSVSYGR